MELKSKIIKLTGEGWSDAIEGFQQNKRGISFTFLLNWNSVQKHWAEFITTNNFNECHFPISSQEACYGNLNQSCIPVALKISIWEIIYYKVLLLKSYNKIFTGTIATENWQFNHRWSY